MDIDTIQAWQGIKTTLQLQFSNLKDIFEAIDQNKNGTIEINEFKDFLKIEDSKAENVFRMVNTSNSGSITQDEFEKQWTKADQLLNQANVQQTFNQVKQQNVNKSLEFSDLFRNSITSSQSPAIYVQENKTPPRVAPLTYLDRISPKKDVSKQLDIKKQKFNDMQRQISKLFGPDKQISTHTNKSSPKLKQDLSSYINILGLGRQNKRTRNTVPTTTVSYKSPVEKRGNSLEQVSLQTYAYQYFDMKLKFGATMTSKNSFKDLPASKNIHLPSFNDILIKIVMDIKPNNQTKDRVAACKAYIERKYQLMLREEQEKKVNWQLLNENMQNLNFTPIEQDLIKKEIMHKEAQQLRKKRQKLSVLDFEPIAIIGRGAFGEVRVCRDKETREIVAIKKMKKSDMSSKNQLGHVRAERDILVHANSSWVVNLKASFQDEQSLYLVMEFLSGGDFMSLLIKQDIIPERDARFYAAELVLAVESIHNLKYIHRDLKPDNILIDSLGHLKLSDFGLCKHMGQHFDMAIPYNSNPVQNNGVHNKRQLAFSTVGTPDYIAPEVFSQKGYNELVDWWSVGVILFEMVIGYPPFYSDTPQKTCQKIVHWKKHFAIPKEPKISQNCADLIRKLMCDPSERLCDAAIIKKHPFFFGIDFENIRNMRAPHIPDKSKINVNFDKFEETEPWYTQGSPRSRQLQHFQGYTYKRNGNQEMSPVQRALEELENIKPSGIRANFDKKQKSQSPPHQPIQASFQRSQSPPSLKEQIKQGYMQYISPLLSPLNSKKPVLKKK